MKQYKKIHKLNTTEMQTNAKYRETQTTLVQSPLLILSQKMRWTDSTTLLSPHGDKHKQLTMYRYLTSLLRLGSLHGLRCQTIQSWTLHTTLSAIDSTMFGWIRYIHLKWCLSYLHFRIRSIKDRLL